MITVSLRPKWTFVAKTAYFMLLCFVIFLLGSCSVCKNVERAERKVARIVECHPELALKDTVEFEVLVPEKVLVHDTSFVMSPIDTIMYENQDVKFQFIRVHDTLYVDNIIAKRDTVIQMVEVPVEIKVAPKPNFFQRVFSKSRILKTVFGIVLLILIAVGIIAQVRNR